MKGLEKREEIPENKTADQLHRPARFLHAKIRTGETENLEANRVQFPAGSPLDVRMWSSCWTMPLFGGFSRGLFHRPALNTTFQSLRTGRDERPVVVLYSLQECAKLQTCLLCVENARAEQRRNVKAGKTGDPRENPLTSGIVRYDSHVWKSKSNPAGNRIMFALVGGTQEFHTPFHRGCALRKQRNTHDVTVIRVQSNTVHCKVRVIATEMHSQQ
ncbi:hypothetical protein PR048_007018 [Dryococelus australis]|uniref:Uncharacterized protein n=1 Tax=Dryococelus australis TaxID=614101 RepID=A0ABQ9ID15_9NEOP|nr:hypothetical protein PR048_007018 [Dryococelus australis]